VSCPDFASYTLEFVLQLRKITENLSQGIVWLHFNGEDGLTFSKSRKPLLHKLKKRRQAPKTTVRPPPSHGSPRHAPIPFTYAPVASMWVVTLHNLFLYSDPPLPCHFPTNRLRLFSSQTFSRINAPTFSNLVILTAGIDTVDMGLRSYFVAPASEPKSTNPGDVQEAIRGLKVSKAPGPNGIPNRALKHLQQRAVSLLVLIFNPSLSYSVGARSSDLYTQTGEGSSTTTIISAH
jgi:hypothetical protein